MYITPNEPVIVSIGNQDKMFDTINSAVDFLEQKARNAQVAINELPIKERFNKRIFTFCLSHGQHDKIGEFLYRMMYPLKTVKRLRGEDRCYGYDHDGGQHTLTIRISLEEMLELKQELLDIVCVKTESEAIIVDINLMKINAIIEYYELPYSILCARIKELKELRDSLPEDTLLGSSNWNIRIRDFWDLENKIFNQK